MEGLWLCSKNGGLKNEKCGSEKVRNKGDKERGDKVDFSLFCFSED